ncbi:MAG: site-specific integrase, partial [Clostridia bacterium]
RGSNFNYNWGSILVYHIQYLGLKSNTVIHYHANINSALKYAVKIDLIPSNPADKIDKPKKQTVITSYYAIEELEVLFEKVHNTQIEIPVLIASHYGLRRSEVIGLKWNAVDFNKQEKERQCKNKKLYKSGYNTKYQEYICVNEIGNLISPEYVSHKFPEIIQKYELKHIRFHDLRHSCASLLLKNGASIKQIQEWLGHSNYNTTANTYTHLDPTANKASADIINITFSNSKQKKSLV